LFHFIIIIIIIIIVIIVIFFVFIIAIITILLPVRYFGTMIMCSSWFIYYLVVQDRVLGITLCFDGFMWIYCDSPRCMTARI